MKKKALLTAGMSVLLATAVLAYPVREMVQKTNTMVSAESFGTLA